MKFNPRPMAVFASLLVIALAAECVTAQAKKPTLSADLFQVTEPFTPQQQETVETYANYYIDQMLSSEKHKITDARAELKGPLAKGGRAEFHKQYSAIVSRLLNASAVMDREHDVLVRLNAMIVTSALEVDDHVVASIERGVADASPAVRYWAVRCISKGAIQGLNTQQRQKLIVIFDQQRAAEKADAVMRQLLLALIKLDAVDEVAKALNDLIKPHIGKPQLPFDAKQEAIRSLSQKIQVLDNKGQPVDEPFRQLARAACRYMILITQQAQGGDLPGNLEREQLNMVKLCDLVLRVAHTRFKSTASAPGAIDSAVFGRNWPALQAAALQWRQVLTKPPFNFADVDLSPAGGGGG